MKPILEVTNISKKFRVGASAGMGLTFRERIMQTFNGNDASTEFWALNDVSFNVNAGESVGIIGKNGAGKSTLLKILSKITPSTSGRIITRGRIASLLEVGTGFHSELTGRENIFFNGSLLGMKRKEIEAKFDEIVDFSGVGRFLDTALKHYSSGMQLRLAFAVAAFLEPEILVIDEVLAVGDAEFQKKCLGKMESVSKSGRTILFVSHNMSFIETMCPRTILLASGRVKDDGDTHQIIGKYLSDTQNHRAQNDTMKLAGGVVVSSFTLPSETIKSFDDLLFSFTIESPETNKVSELALLIYNDREERVAIADLRHQRLWDRSASSLQLTVEGAINSINLIPGRYSLGLYISSNLCKGDFYNLKSFEVEFGSTGDVIPFDKKYRGYLDVRSSFEIK